MFLFMVQKLTVNMKILNKCSWKKVTVITICKMSKIKGKDNPHCFKSCIVISVFPFDIPSIKEIYRIP